MKASVHLEDPFARILWAIQKFPPEVLLCCLMSFSCPLWTWLLTLGCVLFPVLLEPSVPINVKPSTFMLSVPSWPGWDPCLWLFPVRLLSHFHFQSFTISSGTGGGTFEVVWPYSQCEDKWGKGHSQRILGLDGGAVAADWIAVSTALHPPHLIHMLKPNAQGTLFGAGAFGRWIGHEDGALVSCILLLLSHFSRVWLCATP